MRYMIVCSVIISMLLAATAAAAETQGDECGQGRMAFSARPESCPCCGHSPVASILYGKPQFSESLRQAMQEGRIAPGGCMLPEDPPRWRCFRCRAVFYQSGKAEASRF